MIGEILSYIWNVFVDFLELTWWFWTLAILIPLARSALLFWRQSDFKHNLKYVFLEIKIPREIKKSPQGMEQVLASLYALRNKPNDLGEKYLEGEVTRWFALEMVSFEGEIHFYLRAPIRQKNLVEAAFLSYYPDVELIEVDDHAQKLPESLREMYGQGFDLWGTEMVLSRKAAYPIKSYKEFEAIEEEKQFDPISTFLEVLGKLQAGEFVGIQILIQPGESNWYKDWYSFVEKLKEPKIKKGEGTSTEQAFAKLIARSPGETDVLKAVEENLSKPAFNTLIRFIYLSPKPGFYDTYPRRGLVGAFNQYSALDLNSFRQNYPMSTRTRFWNFPHVFYNRRNEYRKSRMLYNYTHREMPEETVWGKIFTSYLFNWSFNSKTFLMNIESIATIFHPPTSVVLTAPHMMRVESRKTGPPAGLAIFGDEKEIEKFQ